MTEKLQIRPLDNADAELFKEVRLNALQECPTAFTADYAATKERAPRFFATQIEATPDRFMLGAFDEKKLVALCGFFRSEGPKLWHRGHIWSMYVDPSWRRQGVARRLLDEVVARARAMQDLVQVHLSVVLDRPDARRLYLAYGFQVTGREPRALHVGGSFYDEELMVLRIV